MVQALSYARPVFIERQSVAAAMRPRVRWVMLTVGSAGALVAVVFAMLLAAGRVRSDGWVVGLILGGGGMAFFLVPFWVVVTTVVEPGAVRFQSFMGGVRFWWYVVPLAKVRTCDVVQPGGVMPGVNGYRLPKGFHLQSRGEGRRYVLLAGREAVVLELDGGELVAVASARSQEMVEAVRAMRSETPAEGGS